MNGIHSIHSLTSPQDSPLLSPESWNQITEEGRGHLVIIQTRFLDLIINGQKTVEGKVDKPRYRSIQEGHLIKFVSSTNSELYTFCVVKKRTQYPSFEEMLKTEGLSVCLPKVKTIKEGIAIYHSFPCYQEDEKIYRVVAFKIEKLNEPFIGEMFL